jgi:hypothetical protein
VISDCQGRKPIELLTKFKGKEPGGIRGLDAGLFEVPEGFDDPLLLGDAGKKVRIINY